MRIVEIRKRTPELLERLLAVWESSVRATHLFLTEEEILRIRDYVPQALAGVARLFIAEDETGCPAAFMGVENGKLEMLFVSAEHRGEGYGSALLKYGMERCGVETLTVNEQNPQAVGFYTHMGFQTVSRSPVDEQGGPYPILLMKRQNGEEYAEI